MGYSHNKGFSATESGYAVGAAGSEVSVIDGNGKVTLIEPLAAVVGSTTATREGGSAIPNAGVSTIASTSGQRNYTLVAPVAGAHKTIVCTAGTTDNLSVVMASTGVTFDGTNTVATFNAAEDFLDLIGLSATRWLVKTNGGSVALATT